MIPNTNDHEVITKGIDSKAFTINASAEAFRILSDGIYSNKKRAIVREISCNALDSHRAAGRSELAFDVHLPSSIEPYFSVRDYGIGLCREDVEDLYTTYFASTKNTSNKFTGEKGLGSKSPFSYVDSFTVTSFFNREESSYAIFINDKGEPSIAHLNSKETDKPNGLCVEMPVKDTDIWDFKEEAKDIYAYFDVKPNVTGSWGFEHSNLSIINSYSDGKIVEVAKTYSKSKIVAVEGNVAYPILNTEMDTSALEPLLGNGGLVLYFDIGNLSTAASREALQWDSTTKERVQEALREAKDHIYKELNDKLEGVTVEIEAKRILKQFFDERYIDHYTAKDIKIQWNGTELTSNPYNIQTMDYRKALDDDLAEHHIFLYKPRGNTCAKFNPWGYRRYIKFNSDRKSIICIDEKTGFNKKIAYQMDQENANDCFAFRAKSEDQIKKVSDLFGGVEIIKTSEIEIPKYSTLYKSVKRKSSRVMKLKEFGYDWEEHTVDINDITQEYVYVKLYRSEVDGCSHRLANIKAIAEHKKIDIIGIRSKALQTSVENKINWISFDDYMDKQVLPKVYKTLTKNSQIGVSESSWLKNVEYVLKKLDIKDDVVEFAGKVKGYETRCNSLLNNIDPGRRAFYNILSTHKKEINEYSPVFDLKETEKSLLQKHPILSLVDLHYGVTDEKIAILKNYINK